MSEFKPVTISKGAFAFCRSTIAVMFWAALLLQLKGLVFAGFVILILSYLLKVKKAPLIVLYSLTIDKIAPSTKIVVDEKGIRFAHLVGTVFSGVCTLLLYYVNTPAGWAMTFLLAIMNTSAAFGFCSALKLYGCMTGGTSCCRMGRRIRKYKNV